MTLVRASCTTRYTARPTPADASWGLPETVRLTLRPASRSPDTRLSRSLSPGRGRRPLSPGAAILVQLPPAGPAQQHHRSPGDQPQGPQVDEPDLPHPHALEEEARPHHYVEDSGDDPHRPVLRGRHAPPPPRRGRRCPR